MQERLTAQATAAADLAREGHRVRLWRPPVTPGESKAVGLYRADWQIVLPDGTAIAEVRYTLQTPGGDALDVQARGVRHGSAEALARRARGEDVDASEYTFRTSTQIETAAADLDWLNDGVFVSVGGRQPAGVGHETYLFQ